MSTPSDFHALLTQLFTSENYLNILRYYQEPSMMELFGKERDEKCHSRFIAWLLGNSRLDFKYDSPLYRFLNLLYLRAHDQGNPVAGALSAVLFSSTHSMSSLQTKTEVQIHEETYGDGYLDVFIQARISDRNLNVIIENKVFASETKKKKKGEDGYIFQSDGYAAWLKKEYTGDHNLNLLVFLSPISSSELERMDEKKRISYFHCKDYIHINYQDILDTIIEPFIEKAKNPEFQIATKDKIFLEDYKRALGRTTQSERSNTIMAMNEEEKNMLIRFLDNNKALILAALQAKMEDPRIDDDERSELETMRDCMQHASRPRQHFTLDGNGSYSMFEATNKFIHLMIEKHTISEIQEILKSCGIALLSQDEWDDKSDNTQKKFEKIGDFDGEAYYLTHGYAFNITKSAKNPTFRQLMRKAKEFGIIIEPITQDTP